MVKKLLNGLNFDQRLNSENLLFFYYYTDVTDILA
jgi:hypothetical protein